jgi:hypothetical protein
VTLNTLFSVLNWYVKFVSNTIYIFRTLSSSGKFMCDQECKDKIAGRGKEEGKGRAAVRVVYPAVMTVSCCHVVSCRDGPLRHDTIGSM